MFLLEVWVAVWIFFVALPRKRNSWKSNWKLMPNGGLKQLLPSNRLTSLKKICSANFIRILTGSCMLWIVRTTFTRRGHLKGPNRWGYKLFRVKDVQIITFQNLVITKFRTVLLILYFGLWISESQESDDPNERSIWPLASNMDGE